MGDCENLHRDCPEVAIQQQKSKLLLQLRCISDPPLCSFIPSFVSRYLPETCSLSFRGNHLRHLCGTQRKSLPQFYMLKVLTNEKRGLKVVALSCSRGNVKPNWCSPHPVRGLKLLIETCFFYLQTIIVFQLRYSFGAYKKIRETCMPSGELNIATGAYTPNIAKNSSVIWKDLWWWADPYRLLEYRVGCTIPLFQLSVWCEQDW